MKSHGLNDLTYAFLPSDVTLTPTSAYMLSLRYFTVYENNTYSDEKVDMILDTDHNIMIYVFITDHVWTHWALGDPNDILDKYLSG